MLKALRDVPLELRYPLVYVHVCETLCRCAWLDSVAERKTSRSKIERQNQYRITVLKLIWNLSMYEAIRHKLIVALIEKNWRMDRETQLEILSSREGYIDNRFIKHFVHSFIRINRQ